MMVPLCPTILWTISLVLKSESQILMVLSLDPVMM